MRNNDKYRAYSWLDYALLPVVLLANVLLVPVLLPMLPGLGAIDGWFAPACIVVCAPLGCAYIWQLAAVNRFPGLNLWVLTIIALSLYLIGFKLDSRDTMISGVLGAEVVFWTSLRLVISMWFNREKSSVV